MLKLQVAINARAAASASSSQNTHTQPFSYLPKLLGVCVNAVLHFEHCRHVSDRRRLRLLLLLLLWLRPVRGVLLLLRLSCRWGRGLRQSRCLGLLCMLLLWLCQGLRRYAWGLGRLLLGLRRWRVGHWWCMGVVLLV